MPNTHVPAAGEAMPGAEGMQIVTGRFSRRAMLVGAVASIPAIAGAVGAPAEHPDSELIRLDAEMDALQARSDALGRELAQIENLAEEAAGPKPVNPNDWKGPTTPDDIKAMKTAWLDKARPLSVEEGRAACPPEVRAWLDACQDERDRVKAEWDDYGKRRAMHEKLLGIEEKEAEDQEQSEAVWQLGMRIFETPAHTFEGLAIKIRAGERLNLDDFNENEALASIAADIRRLAVGRAS